MTPKLDTRPLGPSRLFFLQIAIGSLVGSLLFALGAYEAGYLDLAKGLFLGALLSPLHLLGLKTMSARVLAAGEAGGPGLFRIFHILRWFLFAFVIWALLTISVYCLLGALVSYTWFLLVMAWAGLRAAMPKKKTPLSGL